MALLCLSATTFISCSNDDDTEEIIRQDQYQTKSTSFTETGIGKTNPENGDNKDKGGIKIPNPKK